MDIDKLNQQLETLKQQTKDKNIIKEIEIAQKSIRKDEVVIDISKSLISAFLQDKNSAHKHLTKIVNTDYRAKTLTGTIAIAALQHLAKQASEDLSSQIQTESNSSKATLGKN